MPLYEYVIINNDGSDPVVGTFAGLAQGASFLIGGTPFQISYTGGSGNDVVLTVACPTISLMPTVLPNGIGGVTYNQTISALPSGGGYTFAHTGGTLPPGLTLMSNGTLGGVPLTNGSFTFTVTATGFSPYACTGSQTYTVTIGCPTIALTPAGLPNGTAGVAYSQAIGATPAGGGYTFAVTTGAVIRCRPIGVLQMDDEAGGDAKLLAVPVDRILPIYKHWQRPEDLQPERLMQIQHFFEHYKDLEVGKWVKVRGWGGPEEARREILDGLERYRQADIKPYF